MLVGVGLELDVGDALGVQKGLGEKGSWARAKGFLASLLIRRKVTMCSVQCENGTFAIVWHSRSVHFGI
jgi:hypothetical protein